MTIKGELYNIDYSRKMNTIFFAGTLRLNDLKQLEKIKQFMLDIYGLDTQELNLDFARLDFLNSAGISTLCSFILTIKNQNRKIVRIIGNNHILWQKKSFENLKILWDGIQIVFK